MLVEYLPSVERPPILCIHRPAQLFPFRFGVRTWPSGPGFDWRAQVVRRDLVGQIFRYSDRGLLLSQFGIGAQLGIGERGIYYYTVVYTGALDRSA